MDNKRNEGRKQWALNHSDVAATSSMKRRMARHDYCKAAIYMVTMCVEGRHPILGTLHGPDDNHPQPWVSPTQLGERIKAEWLGVPRYFPQIKVLALMLMPDHLHGILHVTEELPVHFGQIISGFKAGCNRIARGLGEQCPLWEKGYNDKVLQGADQLNRWFEYLRDNPRRLWIKRHCYDLFSIKSVTVAGVPVMAMGNLKLLDCPSILQVYCSRRLNDEEIAQEGDHLLSQAAKGAVLVSPAISPGEKRVLRRAFEAELPIILICKNGFGDLSKPHGKLFDACAAGKVLLISQHEHRNDYQALTKENCREMNVLARAIATQR